jgi:hypothetical protein
MGETLTASSLEVDGMPNEAHPSIQQLVYNLRRSLKAVEGKIGMRDVSVPSEHESARQSTAGSSRKPGIPPKPPGFTNVDLHDGLGGSLSSAISRALGANRFGVVRDSLTGHQADALMLPPTRPFADERNVLTVRDAAFTQTSNKHIDMVKYI